MHDLETIKRLNRNPSKRFERDKPAPQPARWQSAVYDAQAYHALDQFREEMQSPATDTRSGYLPLDE